MQTSVKVGMSLFILFALSVLIGAHAADKYVQRERHSQLIEMISGINQKAKALEEICRD
jgi:hypothetical protein